MANESPTKEKLLDVAHDLFLSHGFSATSVDTICRKAKITKGGFFHYFKSKDELGKAVLQRFCAASQRYIEEKGCSKLTDPLDRVFANLDCVVEYVRSKADYKGCLIATFTQEMSHSHPEIQEICSQGLKQWAQWLKDDLVLVKKQYAPKSRIDIANLADYCVSVIEGAQVLAKATQNPTVIAKSIDFLKEFLQMLFKTPKHKESRS